jgi:predicted transposase YdaD
MYLLMMMVGLASATSPDYVTLQVGEPAPFSGRLFTEQAVVEIVTENDRLIEQCQIDSKFKLEKAEANFQLKYDLLNARYTSEIEMYQTMIQVRDTQIKKDKKKDVLQKWVTYGAFVLGVGTTVGITHAVNQGFR